MIHMEVSIKGKLDPGWSDWFDGMEIRPLGQEDTQLIGDLPDQSAVYGVLSRLSSLHLALISVNCEE